MAGSWSDSDEDALTADKSGEILFEVLTGLKHNGKLSAKDVCIIGWWVAQAGAVGPVRALAKALGDPSSGHYSMHFDSVCGIVKDNPKHYSLQVPMFDRAEGLRKEQSLACLPPHEASSGRGREQNCVPPPDFRGGTGSVFQRYLTWVMDCCT